MVALPGATPVAVPVVLMVAKAVGTQLHVPPGVASVMRPDVPGQSVNGPLITAGNGLTVTTTDLEQPKEEVYKIVAVPVTIPLINPVVLPAVAIEILLLLQVPPGVGSLKRTDDPAQTMGVPVIVAGNGFTVTGLVVEQPDPIE